MARRIDPETVFELSLALAAALVIGMVGVLVYGQIAGGAARGRREGEGAPERGSIPGERHEHVGAVSAR
jgi:hypothetical protein